MYSFVYVVQIMQKRRYCTADFILIQQTAVNDVCTTASYASDIRHSCSDMNNSLWGGLFTDGASVQDYIVSSDTVYDE
jgi:hypothetical protein